MDQKEAGIKFMKYYSKIEHLSNIDKINLNRLKIVFDNNIMCKYLW